MLPVCAIKGVARATPTTNATAIRLPFGVPKAGMVALLISTRIGAERFALVVLTSHGVPGHQDPGDLALIGGAGALREVLALHQQPEVPAVPALVVGGHHQALEDRAAVRPQVDPDL